MPHFSNSDSASELAAPAPSQATKGEQWTNVDDSDFGKLRLDAKAMELDSR